MPISRGKTEAPPLSWEGHLKRTSAVLALIALVATLVAMAAAPAPADEPQTVRGEMVGGFEEGG